MRLKIVFSRDGTELFSAAEDGTVRLWNTKIGELIVTLKGHSGAVTCCAISIDGKRALSGGDDDTVRFWDLEKNEQLAEFKGHGTPIYAVAFAPGAKEAVSVASNHTIYRWNLDERKEVSHFTCGGIRASPNGRPNVLNMLVAHISTDTGQALIPSYWGTVHLIDTKSQSELGTFGAWGLRGIALSKDETLMACLSEHELTVWDVATRTQKAKLLGGNGGLRTVAFTGDGQRLVVGASNQPTRVWDIESKAIIGELSEKSPAWTAVAVSADGNWAASGEDKGKIFLWPLSWIDE